MCVKNKMTSNGPNRVRHELKFKYRAHIGPIWALFPNSAHMRPTLSTMLAGIRPKRGCIICYPHVLLLCIVVVAFFILISWIRRLDVEFD